jgi:hypothetical protein
MPSFDRLIDALESLIATNPGTTFVGAHVGCAAEDLGRVSRMLGTYPNFHVDLGGRMAELGRQPRASAALIRDHPAQVLFGTDAFPIEEAGYRRWFRFLETSDECFGYSEEDVPPAGRWDVSALGLTAAELGPLYGGNARRVLGLGSAPDDRLGT